MAFLGLNFPLWRSRNSATTTLASPAEWLVRELLRSMAKSGIAVTPLRALGVSTVFSCVNAISRSLSTFPLKLHRRLPNGRTVEARDHPLYALLSEEPNEEMTSASMVRAVQANATLRNAGYALIVRNGMNEVVEIYPIEPADIKVGRNSTTKRLEYEVAGKRVDQSSLLCVVGLTFNGVLPPDMLSIARECVGLAIALQDNASVFFGNGSRPGGVLEHPASLSEEAQERLRKQIEDKHKGTDKAYQFLILEEGLKLSTQREENNSAQFLESRVYQDKAVARHFGIQQHKVGILDNAHFNNVEQENINYVTDTMLPWVVQWEQELNRKLLSKEERASGLFFRLHVDGLLRGDSKTRSESLQIQRRMGIISQNEWRRLEDMDPAEGGDVYLVDQALQPVGSTPSTKQTQPNNA